MLILAVGGSASGKSHFAESTAVSLADGGPLYYLATLDSSGAGCEEIIRRHLEKREGKGFVTVEAPRDIDRIPIFQDASSATVLLECVPNLLANEMFGRYDKDAGTGLFSCKPEDMVLREILALAENVKNLVAVSGLIFSSGDSYEQETRQYIESLGHIHTELLARADVAVEIVSGSPVYLKGECACIF